MSLSASPSTPKELWRPMQNVPTQKRIGSESRNRKRKAATQREREGERVHLCLKNFGPLKPNKCWSLLVPLVSCLVEWLYLPARRQKEISPDRLSHSCLQKEKPLNNRCRQTVVDPDSATIPSKYTHPTYITSSIFLHIRHNLRQKTVFFCFPNLISTLSRCNLDTFLLWQDFGPRTCSQPWSCFSTATSNCQSGFSNHTHTPAVVCSWIRTLLFVLSSACTCVLCFWNYSAHS